jgi:hypothetical protein
MVYCWKWLDKIILEWQQDRMKSWKLYFYPDPLDIKNVNGVKYNVNSKCLNVAATTNKLAMVPHHLLLYKQHCCNSGRWFDGTNPKITCQYMYWMGLQWILL